MASYLKEAWEMHIAAGEKLLLTPAPHEKLESILGSLRNYKSRSVKAYADFGMIELAQTLQAATIRFKQTPAGLIVWLEEKQLKQAGTFTILSEEQDA